VWWLVLCDERYCVCSLLVRWLVMCEIISYDVMTYDIMTKVREKTKTTWCNDQRYVRNYLWRVRNYLLREKKQKLHDVTEVMWENIYYERNQKLHDRLKNMKQTIGHFIVIWHYYTWDKLMIQFEYRIFKSYLNDSTVY